MRHALREYLGRHNGQTAWLFGKGPSLDSFDMSHAGKIRCAVNDVVGHVPDITYCFSNDRLDAWLHLYQKHHVVFHPTRTHGDSFTGGKLPDCEVCLFDDDYDDNRLHLGRDELAAKGLAIRHGTIGSTIQILYIMGIAKVVCVGIDGGQQWANKEFLTGKRNDHGSDYNRIREQFIQAAEILGIRLEFFCKSGLTTKGGKMKVRILESTIGGDGESLSQGMIVDLLPSVAERLILFRKAEAFVEPVRNVQVETATVNPVMETADVKPVAKKKAGRRKSR